MSSADWCTACLQDETRVIAAAVISGVPLCRGCKDVFSDDNLALADLRQWAKDNPEPHIEVAPEPEQKKPPVPAGNACSRCGCTLGENNKSGVCTTCQNNKERFDGSRAEVPSKPATPVGAIVVRKPYKPEERAVAAEALTAGASIREAAKESGLATRTVKMVREEVKDTLPEKCGCGGKLGHRGWCKARFEKSPARQETLKAMHTQQRTVRKTVEVELVEREEIKNTERVSQIRIELPSGAGELTLRFEGKLFELSPSDRNLLFGMTDRMRAYASGEQTGIEAPKKFHIMPAMEQTFTRDMFDCLDPAEQKQVVEWLQQAAEATNERGKP